MKDMQLIFLGNYWNHLGDWTEIVKLQFAWVEHLKQYKYYRRWNIDFKCFGSCKITDYLGSILDILEEKFDPNNRGMPKVNV